LSSLWEKIREGFQFVGIIIGIWVIVLGVQECSSPSKPTVTSTTAAANQSVTKAADVSFTEGQRLDVDGNGEADLVVRNGRLIETVSGDDLGPATLANFNSRKMTDQDKAQNWQFRDEGWEINGQRSTVIVFKSPMQNCTGFTLGLKIVTTDSTVNNFAISDLGLNWPVYVWPGGEEVISKAGDIKITKKDDWIYADITFSSRNVYWILFQAPRRANGSWSGYRCEAKISRVLVK
jgi:hypothetical protein